MIREGIRKLMTEDEAYDNYLSNPNKSFRNEN